MVRDHDARPSPRRLAFKALDRLETLIDPYRSMSKLTVDLPTARRSPTREGYLAVVAIFRNERPYLAEWLTFHRLAGVEHVYLYDNGSTDDPQSVLRPFIDSGFVTLTPWPLRWRIIGNIDAQLLAYTNAVHEYGHRWRWMTFIDIDEFVFAPDTLEGEVRQLPSVLGRLEDLPVLTLYMTMFGSNGHVDRPEGLVIENYPKHAPFPHMAGTKVLCDPGAIRGIGSVHYFETMLGTGVAFDEQRRRVHIRGMRRRGADVAPVSDRLRLHHYYIRSRTDWDEKIAQRRTGYSDPKVKRLEERGLELERVSTEHCPIIIPFIERVRESLWKDSSGADGAAHLRGNRSES